MQVRVQKLLAEAGIASRRASEDLIREGHVTINGQAVRELGVRVDPEKDVVTFDGKRIRAREKLYLLLNKPRGYICTKADPQNRPQVTDLLPPHYRHVFPVGRLDYDSEGLLLLTNDGEFCLRLTHPRFGVLKTYHVTTNDPVFPPLLAELEKGIWNENERLRATRAHLLHVGKTARVIEVVLAEGKNREIRRLFAALRCSVQRLKRIRVGPLELGHLPVGRWRPLRSGEVKALLKFRPDRPARPPRSRRPRSGASAKPDRPRRRSDRPGSSIEK